MTREEYKEYTAKVMEEEKQKHYEEEEKIKTEHKFKKKLLPTWIKLSKNIVLLMLIFGYMLLVNLKLLNLMKK